MSALVETAIKLAAEGLPGFPCGANKKPCWSKDEGGRGFHDATLDPAEIRRLFAHRGAHLIGVPTGEVSGFDVLDIDPRHGGDEWERANLHRLPETRIHRTRSGGRHYLFQHAPGMRNDAGKRIASGVDVRGDGGFIVWWPAHDLLPDSEAPLAHWPDWLLPLALPKPKPEPVARDPNRPRRKVPVERLQEIIDRELLRVSNAVAGQRHFVRRNAALLLGGIQAAAGFTDAEAVEWILNALPPETNREAQKKTILWGLENGRANPIDLPLDKSELTPAEQETRRKLARVAINLMKAGADKESMRQQIVRLNHGLLPALPPDRIAGIASWAIEKAGAR